MERLYRGGSNTVDKQHFTLLYSRARDAAFTSRNIRSGWSKAGLFPFNPERVLAGLTKPTLARRPASPSRPVQELPVSDDDIVPQTPTTSTSLCTLRNQLERSLDVFDESSRLYVYKIANAAEKAFADRAILFDENWSLTEQNNEKTMRQSIKRNIVAKSKIMSYKDIMEAKDKREQKEQRGPAKADRESERRTPYSKVSTAKRARTQDMESATREFKSKGLVKYCSVLEISSKFYDETSQGYTIDR